MRSSPGKAVLPSMSQRVSNVGASSVRRMCGACAKWPVMSAKASFAQMICPVVASATTVGSGDFVTAGRISPPSISIFSIRSYTRCRRSASLRIATMRRMMTMAMPMKPYGFEKYRPQAANSKNST